MTKCWMTKCWMTKCQKYYWNWHFCLAPPDSPRRD
jgi:hypothetical protein